MGLNIISDLDHSITHEMGNDDTVNFKLEWCTWKWLAVKKNKIRNNDI